MEGEEERAKGRGGVQEAWVWGSYGLNLTSIPYSFIDPGKYYFVLIF